jgi:hypothetical protein
MTHVTRHHLQGCQIPPPPSPRLLENKMLDNVIINQTQVKKKFGRHVFTSTVTKYNQKSNLYFIEYTDGDCEEMTEKNIQKY